MKPAQEIIVKILILMLVIFLLVVDIMVIDIRVVRIVITLVAVILMVVIIVVEVRRPRRLCNAFIYQHKELRTFLYCENDQGDETRDFRKVGEGPMPCDQVNRCSLVP